MIAKVTITQTPLGINSSVEDTPIVEAEIAFRNWYKGDKGDQGVSGVYVGSGEMPEGYNVQVDVGDTDVIVIPSRVSELINDKGYATAAEIAAKADKATTLAGYGIEDAYTKREMDVAIPKLVTLTQAEYDALTPIAGVYYFIREE